MPSPQTLDQLSGRACSIQCADALARVSEPWEMGIAVCEGCGARVCLHVAPFCEQCRERDFKRRWGSKARFRLFARR